ncbi:transcriptional regulator (Cti6), putative [Trichophyton benhamiae CBS 112371]|uniref:Transcriptional regulator (Cti6), putative n=1 Tax=Arthroderma benhamiae (strain ATCC MYA-4681 / CBS 112371) TaxID=663331 RepID=D4ARR4_ARTBC|nr:transcriptional regulator (Cti6), putative [Trichophyton benhamiae CBS 112371]EFE33978.1 transcriptional regulator (Cti6), putative [Trichophyton benhamiae CBS 112371]
MNPRRSSRARATHPASAAMQHSASSSSLNSLSRPERTTRSNNNGNKPTPPRRSAAQRSQSLDDGADTASSKNDAATSGSGSGSGTSTRQQRQSRGREEVEADADADVTLTGDEFDEEGEEEITRCICGHQDYPGLPAHRGGAATASSSKGGKDGDGQGAGSGADAQSDDAGSLFIQCDECKVWQHGGCVGIMEEASSPDEYFCERCRKDLHSIIVGPHGGGWYLSCLFTAAVFLRFTTSSIDFSGTTYTFNCSRNTRYTVYRMASLPPLSPAALSLSSPHHPSTCLAPQSLASFELRHSSKSGSTSSASSTTSRETAKTSKDKKLKSSDTSPRTKRRTMNSRDAAYDEEELLRRAIEESKEDTASLAEETTTGRRGKRSRSVSELNKQAAKRQRTSSPSPSSRSKPSRRNTRSPSEEETKSKTASVNGNQKKTRATRNQREKEPEPEPEPEKEAAPEPVSRRKGRSDRRKGEDSEPPETTSPTKPTPNAPAQSAPDTPTASTPVSKPATRKSGRPPARRGRLGRNQYTRDRDPPNGTTDAISNSPRRGQSREDVTTGDSPTSASNTGPNGTYANGETGKASRPRYMNPNRTTMNDMRRRVAAILEFISRLQVEMAASGEQPTRPPGDSSSTMATTSRDMAATIAKAEAILNGLTNGTSSSECQSSSDAQAAPTSAPAPDADAAGKDKDFKDLTSGEMMDVLTRGLFKWQELFGKYGDK